MPSKKYSYIISSFLLICLIVPYIVQASIIDILKDKIQSNTDAVKKIDEEIKIYQKELENTATKARVLSDDIKVLTNTKKKLEGDLSTTEKNIQSTTKTINQIENEITEKEEKIIRNRSVLLTMLQKLWQEPQGSVLEAFLADQTLSSIGEYFEHTEKFEAEIQNQIRELLDLKNELALRKTGIEAKKKSLAELKVDLSGKKQSVAETERQKNNLLTVTKNQQSNYQKVLTDKIRQKEQFEKEIFSYESELKLTIDKNKLPTAQGGVLQWPIDNVRITQYFGATVDAKRLYVSGSHNGIDLGATDGTKIKAGLSGTVWATGNTDAKAGCYSYGKWVLLKHPNGLSTLHAHLSSVSVTSGQTVSTGDTIGFSGRTGYVTGPHLHFSVLATEGTRVASIPPEKTVNCRGVLMPIADPKAYLDPILYLPKI
jgi:murein DD-endopeptidase MepM/ murein hydrolase activator NlpD